MMSNDRKHPSNQDWLATGTPLKNSTNLKDKARNKEVMRVLNSVSESLRIMSRGPHEIGSTDFDRSKLFFDNFGVPTLVKAVASGQVKYLFICDPIVVVDDKALYLQPVDFLKNRYTALKFVVNNFAEIHIPKSE